MKPFDPRLPVSISNWPKGLRMPPLRRDLKPTAKPEKPKSQTQKPIPAPAEEAAPWWSCD